MSIDTTAWLFEPPQSLDLDKQTSRNVGINIVAQGFRFILQTVSVIILARLLSPADFGLVAMVAVIINFIGLFKDAGLAHATVQRETISHEQISTLFWLNLGLSFVLAVTVVASAPLIVWIYDEPRLLWLSVLLALPILFSGFALQHRALLQRHMCFMAIARADILAQALGVAVGIFAATKGSGYWSLAYMSLTATLCSTLVFWSETRWMPGRIRRNTGVRPMLKFGANLTGFNFVNYFSRNADNFLIGKFIGAAALGQYSRAYSLMLLPLSQINAPIVSALLPALSRLKDDPVAYEQLYLQWVRRIVWLTAIPIAFASIYGEDLVVFLLGAEWRFAGEIFEWLAIAGFLQPLSNLTGVVFTSLGQTDRMFRWGIVSSICIVSAMILGLEWGALGVARAYAVVTVALSILISSYAFAKSPISILRYHKTIFIPVFICCLIFVVS